MDKGKGGKGEGAPASHGANETSEKGWMTFLTTNQ